MASHHVSIILAVAWFATAVYAETWNVEPGTIVATGTFGPVAPNNATTARGRATCFFPLTGNASCSVNLTGSLDEVTMSHIHLFDPASMNPILVALMPQYHVKNGTDVVLLDPAFSFKGSFNFEAALLIPKPDQFLTYLLANKLFVNVHTVAQPGGATMAFLTCKLNCKNPYSPPAAIVATGTFSPQPIGGPPPNITVGGRATLVVVPHGNATLSVRITGSLEEIYESHLLWANFATNETIALNTLPLGREAEHLDPPISFSGSLSYVVQFPSSWLDMWVGHMNEGVLFVNFKTVALPRGAAWAPLLCTEGCSP